MAKLNIDQKSIKDLFEDKKSDFLIPDYQRPYRWSVYECEELWEDIFEFAFPNNNADNFNTEEEYYLGSIVTFRNDAGKKEIIDGQQRLSTLMLLLRAFYVKFGEVQDDNSKKMRENIEKCIWKTDEVGNPDKSALKINSEVAADDDKEELLKILKTGDASDMKSRYAENYRFFQRKIDDFSNNYPSCFLYLPARILNNCILLPIEADDQNTALRIFSTLNDRGMPLSDTDIFKAQFYKYYSSKGQKNDFIEKWKNLEKHSNLDFLFYQYMYYERAKMGITDSTTEGLRKFYEKNKYELLRKDETLENLIDLANFWHDVDVQDNERFSEDVLKKLFVLEFAPNAIWMSFVSVYYLHNRNDKGEVNNDLFNGFLQKMTAFIWAYAVYMPGVIALRAPIYTEMVNIVNNRPVEFADRKFDLIQLKSMFENYDFNNNRPITKAMLAWWAYQDVEQPLLSIGTAFDIEHIYAKNRNDKEGGLSNIKYMDKLGNKSLLEKRINIRASDYRFEDKKKYYEGFTTQKGKVKDSTAIVSLKKLAQQSDFVEADIIRRNDEIIETFMQFLTDNNLNKIENNPRKSAAK
ncbi:MAG: DUF262 domain-containing HNH endonuclease family protein [Bacteroides sp.]|nr:DUF262 domain-containing HNH endonuclease family protein [Prevotella sp.]MCM1408172.1 DUF262 domain-containing HNH endonuclease family protein [Treponema brennaborense]MCM1469496.1 DUF262 domain-containing HNH endonuclease family protein [Bacteroides sp.]